MSPNALGLAALWSLDRGGLEMHEPFKLDFVAYHAGVAPLRPACVDLQSGLRLNYSQLDERISRCAGHLSASLQPGARVAVLARNCIETLIVHFACIRAQMILQPLN